MCQADFLLRGNTRKPMTKTFRSIVSSWLVICLAVTGIVFPLFTPQNASASILTDTIFHPFGGRIEYTQREFCLIPAPPPVFVIPIPFRYVEVGDPSPAKLYILDLLPPGFNAITSKQYDEENINKEYVWALGTYVPEVDDYFRQFCKYNFGSLPDADGIIQVVGTSAEDY